jgi:predicted DNA-binding protein with PD1-like motif
MGNNIERSSGIGYKREKLLFKDMIMAVYHDVKVARSFMGKLDHNGDLLGELTQVCIDNKISLGRVEAIGAVKRARVGYYNQNSFEYEFLDFDRHLEIVGLMGNVSVRDGKPIIHAHVSLSDSEGNSFGGHLAEGTEIFACEFIITEYEGPKYSRGFDDVTKLPLWQM